MRVVPKFIQFNFAKRMSVNDWVNFAATKFIFLFLVTFLAVKDKATPTILGVLLVAFLLSLYLGSVSASVLIAVASALTLSTLTSIYRGLLNFPVSAFWSILLFGTILAMFIFVVKKILDIKIQWKLNLIAVAIALLSFYLIADTRLFRSSGAISALYAWEDNAEWVLEMHKSLNQSLNIEGGTYGSFMDIGLWFSHSVSTLAFPTLTAPDHMATGVIIWTLLLIVAIPFLAVLPAIDNATTGKGAMSSTVVLSLGSTLGFLQLNSIGHLSAAISCLLLTIYLCVSFRLPGDELPIGMKHLFLLSQILLAYLAGVTWFPVAPLSAALIVFSIWVSREIVRKSKIIQWLYFASAILMVYLLIIKSLLTRLPWDRSADEGILSGAKSLLNSASNMLSLTGGNTEIQPWNLLVITVFSMILIFSFATLGLKANAGLISFALVFAYVYVIKFFDLRLHEGVAAYGSKKLEIVLVLIGATFLSWAIVVLFERFLSQKISPQIPALLVSVFLLSMPVAYAIIPGNYYAGLDWAPNVKTSKVISKSLELGRSTVCLNETYQAEAGSTLRLGAYICSRWTSAYSNADSGQHYAWRIAVYTGAGGDAQAFRKVSKALPADTMLIVVGPEDKERVTNNPEWDLLVRKEWLVVR
jgi:hypothetical protein